MDRIVRINVTKNERNVTLNVVNNVIKIIVSQNNGGGGGGVQSVNGVLLNNADPLNPIVNGLIVGSYSQIKEIEFDGATVTDDGGGKVTVTIEGGATPTLQEVRDENNILDVDGEEYIIFNALGDFRGAIQDSNSVLGVSYISVGSDGSTIYRAGAISNNIIDYPLPTGVSSPIATLDDIPINTSNLVNDGENGTSPYVTADQLPSNLNLFATNVSSDIATYFKLVTSIDDPDYNDTAVDIPTGTITTTGQFIAALATTANVLVGNPGIINLLTIGNVRRTSGSGTAEFYYEVYHRTSGGTETLIATSNNTIPISAAIYTEFLAAALLNNGTFLATDRIVVKYYADRVAGGSNPEYDFQFGGTSPVRTTFPVPASNIPLDATPTSGSTNGVQSNGVFDALALKADLNRTKQYLISKPVGNYGSVTGTTAQTVLLSIPILGGVYENGDYLGFNIWTIKEGTAGITTITVRAGTTGTTSDSILGLLQQHVTGQNSAASEREGVLFEDGNFINGRTRPGVSSSSNDLGSFVSYARFDLNPSNDWFLTFTVAHTNPDDEIIVRSYQLSKTKTF